MESGVLEQDRYREVKHGFWINQGAQALGDRMARSYFNLKTIKPLLCSKGPIIELTLMVKFGERVEECNISGKYQFTKG